MAKIKTKYNAKELADIIYEFGVIFRTHNMQIEFGDMNPRQMTRAEDSSLMTIAVFRKNFLSALTDATTLANCEKMSHAKSYIIALLHEERQRMFCSKGQKPHNLAYHTCLF
jgi:hypothetical protein